MVVQTAPPIYSAKQKLLITLPVASLFLALGFNIGSWASRLVDLKAAMTITESQLGIFLFAASLGAICAFPITLWCLNRLGAKRTALLTGFVATLLFPALILNTWYSLGLALMFFEGMCCAILNASMNVLGSELEKEHRFKCMSRLHAVFSLGLATAALTAMASIQFMSSELSSHAILVVCILFGLFLIAGKHNSRNVAKQTDTRNDEHNLVNMTTLLLGAIVFFATIIEGSMNDWSAIYLRDVIGSSASIAPSGILVFSIAMFIGRLFADNLREHFPDTGLIAAAGSLVFIALSTGVYASGLTASWIAFACVGLTVSLVSPAIYATAAAIGPGCLSLIATFGSGGGMVGPPMVGFIATHFGLAAGMYAIAVSGLIITFAAVFLFKRQQATQLLSV